MKLKSSMKCQVCSEWCILLSARTVCKTHFCRLRSIFLSRFVSQLLFQSLWLTWHVKGCRTGHMIVDVLYHPNSERYSCRSVSIIGFTWLICMIGLNSLWMTMFMKTLASLIFWTLTNGSCVAGVYDTRRASQNQEQWRKILTWACSVIHPVISSTH